MTRWPAIVGGAGLMVVALPLWMVLLLTPTASGSCGATGGPPSAVADASIPANLMPIFQAAEQKYGVPWNVLAGINKVETDFGRNLGVSTAGAVGWMQFMPATWARYGVDGNQDGRKDPDDPEDAIPAAAAYLKASGAPGDMHAAVFAYNHSEAYVTDVLGWAARFADGPVLGAPVGACSDESGVPGQVVIAAGANLPGRPLAPETLAFLARVAGLYGHAIVCTTGTNHNQFTVDGNVSDHFDGHACDLGMVANHGTNDGPVGDAIATACLTAAGDPPSTAAREAQAGGLWTRDHNGLRIQCIWKTDQGGNHHDHVHVGARSAT